MTTYKVGDTVLIWNIPFKVTWATMSYIDLAHTKAAIPARYYEQLAGRAQTVCFDPLSNTSIFTFDTYALSDILNKAEEKCSCGGDTVGASRHVYYCGKFKEM